MTHKIQIVNSYTVKVDGRTVEDHARTKDHAYELAVNLETAFRVTGTAAVIEFVTR